jgi:hypothetical protein
MEITLQADLIEKSQIGQGIINKNSDYLLRDFVNQELFK